MSQQELAERAGLRREKVNRFESKGEDISLSDLCRLLDAVGFELIASLANKDAPKLMQQPAWRSSALVLHEPALAPQSFKNARFMDGSKAKVVSWGKVPR